MADQTLARHLNERSVLTMLRRQGPASRAAIARRLSLTPATITKLIAELAQRDLVQEIRDPAQASMARELGRPGVNVALNPAGAYFLGVEIGVGIIRYALLDLTATIAASSEMFVSKTIEPHQAVQAIARHLAELREDVRFGAKIQAVVATVPGVVTADGFIAHLPTLGWKSVALLAELREACQLPALVENDVNAAAFGAIYAQPALPSICAICLTLGVGCSGAVIINGRLLRGAMGTVAALGHIRITDHGHRCSCGQIGCLESWVNLAALARAFLGADELSDQELEALPAQIVAAADAGLPDAQAAIDALSGRLSAGIATLANIFNPTTVMLGGVLRPVIERCLASLQARVALEIVPGSEVPEVRLAPLGTMECAMGAAMIAHHRAFDILGFEFSEH